MKKEGIFTEAIEEPQPPRSFNLGRKVETCDLPKEGMSQSEIENELERMKPDTSPRVWTLYNFNNHRVIDGPKLGDDKIHVIEKSAYDAIAKRVANLAVGAEAFMNMKRELAAAKAEIERLQHVINYDMPHPQLTQANAEIERLNKECISTFLHETRMSEANARIKDCEDRMENTNGLIKQMEEREQKLVAALEKIESATYYTDEIENIRPIAFEALKAHKGGA